MTDWLDVLLRLRAERTPAVVVAVASTRGSAPREAGTKMVVTATDVHGTIGGGPLEHEAIAIARGHLGAERSANAPAKWSPVAATVGQCGGAIVELIFEPVSDDARWLDALATARRDGRDAVVVTRADAATPGKLVVTRDDVAGSPEASVDPAATALARSLLDDGGTARLVRTAAGTLFLDPIRAPDFRIVLFGAGHVGRALVRTLADVSCRITWVDEREAQFPRDVAPNVSKVCTGAPLGEVDAAPAGTYFVVMTHSHAIDEALAERILRRGDFAYFGLIGSDAKRRAFEKRMHERGMPPERLAAMTCPIGVAGIPGRQPAEIAIAVAAQLLQVRATAAGRTMAPR